MLQISSDTSIYHGIEVPVKWEIIFSSSFGIFFCEIRFLSLKICLVLWHQVFFCFWKILIFFWWPECSGTSSTLEKIAFFRCSKYYQFRFYRMHASAMESKTFSSSLGTFCWVSVILVQFCEMRLSCLENFVFLCAHNVLAYLQLWKNRVFLRRSKYCKF